MEKREDSSTVEEEEDEYVSTTSDEEDEKVYDYEELARKFREANKPERVYTEEEIQRDMDTYFKQKKMSQGFDVDYFPSLSEYYCMVIPYINPNSIKMVRECSELALEHYNKDNNTRYELVKVLKTTSEGIGQEALRMTFDAKDDNGDCKTFLGFVYDGIPDKQGNPDREVISVRVKPDQQQQLDQVAAAVSQMSCSDPVVGASCPLVSGDTLQSPVTPLQQLH